jgi:hypothetical protein
MNVNDIAMAGGRTEQPNTSGDVQIHDGNLDVKRLDQTSQTDLTRTAPGLCNHARWDTQGSATMPQLVNAGLHELRFCRLIQGEERTCIEG